MASTWPEYVDAVTSYISAGAAAERGSRHITEAGQNERADAEARYAAELERIDRLDRDLRQRTEAGEALVARLGRPEFAAGSAAVQTRARPAGDGLSEAFARHRAAYQSLDAAVAAYRAVPPPPVGVPRRRHRFAITATAVLICGALLTAAAVIGWI